MGLYIQERKCLYCQAEFYPTAEWVYKNSEGYFCSYGCKRHWEKTDAAQRPKPNRQKRLSSADRKKMMSLIRKGLPERQIAEKMGVTIMAVRYYKRVTA